MSINIDDLTIDELIALKSKIDNKLFTLDAYKSKFDSDYTYISEYGLPKVFLDKISHILVSVEPSIDRGISIRLPRKHRFEFKSQLLKSNIDLVEHEEFYVLRFLTVAQIDDAFNSFNWKRYY